MPGSISAVARSRECSKCSWEAQAEAGTSSSFRRRISTKKLPFPHAGSRNLASVLVNAPGTRSSMAFTSRSWVNASARSHSGSLIGFGRTGPRGWPDWARPQRSASPPPGIRWESQPGYVGVPRNRSESPGATARDFGCRYACQLGLPVLPPLSSYSWPISSPQCMSTCGAARGAQLSAESRSG